MTIGGARFERTLKVETIMPNRLKIALDFGRELLTADSGLTGVLKSMWLHGAPAKGLKADVELLLTPAVTTFPVCADYVFDDPTRRFETEKQTVFDGPLDETGSARVQAIIAARGEAPGKLTANLTTRVFEPGGAFSIDRFSIPYSPYSRYIGIRTPKGDRMRGMLLTDTKHVLDIVAVDPQGAPGRRDRGRAQALQGRLALVVGTRRGESLGLRRVERPHAAPDRARQARQWPAAPGPSRSSTPTGAAI